MVSFCLFPLFLECTILSCFFLCLLICCWKHILGFWILWYVRKSDSPPQRGFCCCLLATFASLVTFLNYYCKVSFVATEVCIPLAYWLASVLTVCLNAWSHWKKSFPSLQIVLGHSFNTDPRPSLPAWAEPVFSLATKVWNLVRHFLRMYWALGKRVGFLIPQYM